MHITVSGNASASKANEVLQNYARAVRASEHLISFTGDMPRLFICEDKEGYLWGLGGVSDRTLYRFNGYEWLDMSRFLKKSDQTESKRLISLPSKEIIVILPDGFYKWLGHGFTKYLLPESERVEPYQISDLLISQRNNKLVVPGTRGYSILSVDGLSYHPNTQAPSPRDISVDIGLRTTMSVSGSRAVHFADSNNSYWHFALPSYDTMKAVPDIKTENYYFTIYQRGTKDSLLLCSVEEYWKYDSGYERFVLRVLDNYALLGLVGADYFHVLDMGKKELVKHQLPGGFKLVRIESNQAGDRILLVCSAGKTIDVHEYEVTNGRLVNTHKASTIMDREYQDYKGVILILQQEVFNLKMDFFWTNNSEDYLFLGYNNLGLTRRSCFEFFVDRELRDRTRAQILGNNLIILDSSDVTNTMKVSVNSFQRNTSESYVIPVSEDSYFWGTFSNEHILVIGDDSKTWHLSLQRDVVPSNENELFPALPAGKISFQKLQNTPNVVITTDRESKILSLYIADGNDQYQLKATLPDGCQSLGFNDGYWYYRKYKGIYAEIYAKDVETATDTRLLSLWAEREAMWNKKVREAAKKGLKVYSTGKPSNDFSTVLISDALTLMQDRRLDVFRGNEMIVSNQASSLADSLNNWFDGCTDSVYEFMLLADLSYASGNIWHLGKKYRFDSEADGLDYLIPTFSYDIVKNELRLHPNIRRITELSGDIWIMEQDPDNGNTWDLQCLTSKQIVFSLPEGLNDENIEDKSLRFLNGIVVPSLTSKEGIWYFYKDEWIFIPSETYSQAGNVYKLLFDSGSIWIIGSDGLCKYTPQIANAFIYREHDGMPNKVYDAWMLGNRLIVTGSDSYLAPFSISTIKKVESGVRVSVPWYEVGSGYYNIRHNPRLKYHQNNIRIPVDILNV